MSDREATTRLDDIEDELSSLRERIGQYRRAMLGSRAVILVGLVVLIGIYTVLPSYGSPTVVVAAIAGVIGATVWLGATKSSKEELDAALARIEAERSSIFDRVAAANGWTDGPTPSGKGPGPPPSPLSADRGR